MCKTELSTNFNKGFATWKCNLIPKFKKILIHAVTELPARRSYFRNSIYYNMWLEINACLPTLMFQTFVYFETIDRQPDTHPILPFTFNSYVYCTYYNIKTKSLGTAPCQNFFGPQNSTELDLRWPRLNPVAQGNFLYAYPLWTSLSSSLYQVNSTEH